MHPHFSDSSGVLCPTVAAANRRDPVPKRAMHMHLCVGSPLWRRSCLILDYLWDLSKSFPELMNGEVVSCVEDYSQFFHGRVRLRQWW